jgi:hypothetical protein
MTKCNGSLDSVSYVCVFFSPFLFVPARGASFHSKTRTSGIAGLPLCESSAGQGGAVAWFSVMGTRDTLRASSCDLPNEFDFTVYSGSCENLACVDELLYIT